MIPRTLTEARDERTFGGKAVALGEGLRRGLPVPDGFALSVRLTRAVAEDEPGALQNIQDLHEQHYQRVRVAVRSSAVGEDSAGASFAGQHLTRLGVSSAGGLQRAIADVWRSGRSDSALAYRRKMGLLEQPEVAVVIQQLVQPLCAGVLFSRDPLDRSDRRVIEASWGLGEAVASGIVTPDRFIMDRQGRVQEQVAGLKDIAIALGQDGEAEEVDVPRNRQTVLCLDTTQLAALNELALRCEAAFDGPQDIEWAWADDKLYLLQSRPITR